MSGRRSSVFVNTKNTCTHYRLALCLKGTPINLGYLERSSHENQRQKLGERHTQLKKGAQKIWSASILRRTALFDFGRVGSMFLSSSVYHKWPVVISALIQYSSYEPCCPQKRGRTNGPIHQDAERAQSPLHHADRRVRASPMATICRCISISALM